MKIISILPFTKMNLFMLISQICKIYCWDSQSNDLLDVDPFETSQRISAGNAFFQKNVWDLEPSLFCKMLKKLNDDFWFIWSGLRGLDKVFSEIHLDINNLFARSVTKYSYV